ncbi:MAG: hypothetical protein IJL43_05600 [Lachnospiraceae bacterium]|nr:hypothetical protein [Lachnospiraceae bacterium]
MAGENRFRIAPIPGGTLTYAEASYRSLYGTVRSCWEKTAEGTRFVIEVPPNTKATVILPGGTTEDVNAGRYTYEI